MGFFFPIELIVFFAIHIWIFVSYISIPIKLNRAVDKDVNAVLSPTNSKLFSSFIFSCGVGHLIYPFIMFVLVKYHESMAEHMEMAPMNPEDRPVWVGILITIWILSDLWTALISHKAKDKLKLEI